MAAVEPAASGELLSERVAGGILPRVLNSFDMVAIFVAIVLFITNAAVIQSAGPTAFGWWILGFLAFLIPGAIVTGQLGLIFPGEGSIYLWTHKAFGAFWGFFAGFCAWWPGVLVMVATGTITLAFLGYVFPGTVGSWSIQAQGVLIIAFILLSAVLAILRFRLTQNIVNTVFVLYSLAIGLMLLAGIVHLARGRTAEVDPAAFSAWAPSKPTGLNFTNWTFFGLVILALLGVEVPLNMGVEIRNTRSIARLIFVSGLDRRLPRVMSHVNANKVPDVGVLVQTIVAAVFTLLAFVILPTTSGGGSAVDVQTKVYDVLQAAVTVIWCVSMVVLFIDVLIILRRYAARFEARRLANPAVFWVCSVIGALASLIGIVATLSGSWTPLISNDSGTVSVLGAKISYGAWFWWVAGIAVASMVVGALLYLLGRRSAASPAPTGAVPAAGPGS